MMNMLNESNLIIPFHYKGKINKFEEYVKADGFKKDMDKHLQGYIWRKASRRRYRYLAAHIDALIDNENKDSICYSYYLNPNYRSEQGWPSEQDRIYMESWIMKGDNKSEAFTFFMGEIRIYIFKTGIGFLVVNIKHENQEELTSIEDKSFSLTRFYTKETTGTAKESELLFTYKTTDKLGVEKNIPFSLSGIVNQILQVTKSNQDLIRLFPSSNKKECNIFHRIIVDRPLEEENLNSHLYILRRAFHSSFYQCKEDACVDQRTDFIFQTRHNFYFSFSQRGMVCLYYQSENQDVFIRHFTGNVRHDYFFIYLFLLHERQALFYFNSILSAPQKKYDIIRMKKILIEFRIKYSYKVISDEASYQNFYSLLYKAFSLDELNVDIQDIIDRGSEHQKNIHENSTNTALAVLALFGIFSALDSSFAFVDRFSMDEPFTWAHAVVSALIFLTVLISIGVFLYLKKRK